ncbi:MAG: type I-A CRISPR-associated protein Cas7/Csa2 [Crenarchaeota archaeon]|nr:type I-A CRISPR-associated protein Cas7/Csa2 [Thermoproteota archaeon]
MFLSIGMRFVANIEALNMVETIGTLSKHRKAPIIVPTDGGYKVLYVPAISGESIAHAYQAKIVELAMKLYQDPPIDKWSLRGEFFKFMDDKHLTEELKEVAEKAKKAEGEALTEAKHEFEKTAIRESIIADIGGFLYADKPPVKRTSVFQVGYVIPVNDAIEATIIESQLHTRHAPIEAKGEEEQKEEKEERGRAAQMLYYVETGSAVYGLTFNIDLDGIGRTSLVRVENAVEEEERLKRIKLALLALSELICEGDYGAKRSRFLPIESIESICAAITTNGSFVISPPHDKNFIEKTYSRAKSYVDLLRKAGLETKVDVHAYTVLSERVEGVKYHSPPEELFAALLNYVI